MLSGIWTRFDNGVDLGPVLMNVNGDMTFSIVDDEGVHNRIKALEDKLKTLLNL